LEAAAEALGQGDLTKRVSIETRDELARLGATFNGMAEQLSRLLRLREEFMAAAAHELKTPIATIRSSIQLAIKRNPCTENRPTLDIIEKQVRRMALLADDLLTVTRMQGPAAKLERRRFDLSELLRETVKRVADSTDKQTISLTCSASLVVEAERKLIELVLIRLLENAIAASPDDGRIEVSCRRANHDGEISVHDEGAGIPSERQAHVFEPFYETVPPGLPGYKGIVSLRLHVCKRILDVHQGRIRFSTTPHGSTFSVSLPLAEEPPSDQPNDKLTSRPQ
jgi:signal transduction histidine kinase